MGEYHEQIKNKTMMGVMRSSEGARERERESEGRKRFSATETRAMGHQLRGRGLRKRFVGGGDARAKRLRAVID